MPIPFGVGNLGTKETQEMERDIRDKERQWEKERDRAQEEGKPIPPHPREYTKVWPFAMTLLAAGCLYGSLSSGSLTNVKESVVLLKSAGIKFTNLKVARFSLLFNILKR